MWMKYGRVVSAALALPPRICRLLPATLD